MSTHEYAFDVTLRATVRVMADTEAEARAKVWDVSDDVDVGLRFENGVSFTSATMTSDRMDLYEVDGGLTL